MEKQTLLVPTDFSDNALVAAQYALDLARETNSNIHILHTYRSFTSAFQSPLANETDEGRGKIAAEKGIDDFVDKLSDHAGIRISSSVSKDNLPVAIEQYTEDNPTRFVVIGAHGASGTRQTLLGSNTYDVAKDTDLPLLVVPHDVKPFRLDKAVFFSDYQQEDSRTLSCFKSLFNNISTTIIHIHEDEAEPTEDDHARLTKWMTKLQESTGYLALDAELVHSPESLAVVNKIVESEAADMMLLTLKESRSFFDRLMHKSLGRAIILNPKIPVLLASSGRGD